MSKPNKIGNYVDKVTIGKYTYSTIITNDEIFKNEYIVLNDMCINWLQTEKQLNSDDPNSTWKLLATFNLRALLHVDGMERFDIMMKNTESTYTINRLYDLLLNLEIVLSYETITICKGKFAHYLMTVACLPEESVDDYFTIYPFFWLLPFIQFNYTNTIALNY